MRLHEIDDWYDDTPMVRPAMRQPYGYWITNTGEVIAVTTHQGHNDFCRPYSTYQAVKMGWIRITIRQNEKRILFSLSCTKNINTKTYRSLVGLCEELDDLYNVQQVLLDEEIYQDDQSRTQFERFYSFRDMQTYLQRNNFIV